MMNEGVVMGSNDSSAEEREKKCYTTVLSEDSPSNGLVSLMCAVWVSLFVWSPSLTMTGERKLLTL